MATIHIGEDPMGRSPGQAQAQSQSSPGVDKKTYKVNVVVDDDDPDMDPDKNDDLKEIPTDWTVKDRKAKEVG